MTLNLWGWKNITYKLTQWFAKSMVPWVCCGSMLSLILTFCFPILLLGVVRYDDNDMIMSLKQKKIKFKPRIKLNHNKYIQAYKTVYSYSSGLPLYECRNRFQFDQIRYSGVWCMYYGWWFLSIWSCCCFKRLFLLLEFICLIKHK